MPAETPQAAIDVELRRKRREEQRQERRQQLRAERKDIEDLMSTASGRRVVYTLLNEAKVFHQTFVPGDPHSTSFNEGRRAIGLWLLTQVVGKTPDQYALMMKEANHDLEA